MPQTPRQRAREQTMRDIVRIGREQLATSTPAELSLRAVARDLGIVSSAVYRYVKDRDELLTLLIVDAYDELGDEVDAAIAAASRRGPRGRLLAAARALREWGVREPSRFALLHGTPVPGYRAPGDRTIEPGTRFIIAIAGIVEDAHRTGRLQAAAGPVPRTVRADLEAIRREYDLQMPAATLARVLGLWSALVGAVAFEVFDQYGAETLSDPAAFFDLHVESLTTMLGLD